MPDSSSSSASSSAASSSQTVETVGVADDSHAMLTTSFSDYTVTEGLLLLIFVILLLKFFLDLIRRWF